MEWYDKFKRFLGLSERQESNDYNSVWTKPPDEHQGINPPFQGRHFNMFTDPIEIHKYFEQQMSEMLSNFGFQEFADGFTAHFNFPHTEEHFEFPQLEAPEHNDARDLRDQFLKPGYENSQPGVKGGKCDKDIDGKLDIKDWSSVLKGDSNSVIPYDHQVIPKKSFFSQKVITKSTRNPDGSVETHHIVSDSQGNEEIKITRKIGDKEHTIIKRRDKDGKEETIEDLTNLNEMDVHTFFPDQQSPKSGPQLWPFFDRFFR